MPTHVRYEEVVPVLLAQFDAVRELAEGFGESDWNTPTCLPGWTVKDVLSHLYGTEAMLLGDKPPEADVSSMAHIKNSTGQFNELWVESLRTVPGSEVLKRFTDVTASRRGELEAMTQDDMDKSSWTPAGADETYGRFMRIRHMDFFLHELDMRDALGLAERNAPEAVSLALEEPAAALGYIVGKKAGMPDGSRVLISVRDPDRDWAVTVDGKARVVEALEGEPTASIELPATLFLRLAGGRTDADPFIGKDLKLGGEEAAARQLAGGLAYMI